MAEPIEWDDAEFEAALARVASDGVIEAAGVALDAVRLARLIDAAPKDRERSARRRLRADFGGAAFLGSADFAGVTFHARADFHAATFAGVADFREAEFTDVADFGEAAFGGETRFGEAVFDGDARFVAATFERARELGPMRVAGALVLDRAEFAQPVRIEIEAPRVSCSRTVFRGATDMFAGGADVSLGDADFAQPSLVTGRLYSQTTRIVSVRRAKVAQLTLSGVDLRTCRFAGAHGLDRMRLEDVEFGRPPKGSRRVGRRRWVRWWPRDTIAEERRWRAWRGHGSGWDEGMQAPEWIGRVDDPVDARTIAGIYRALRKGREDSKDEPGAADFYYGEMEMRRHDPTRRRRIISLLWLYWLVSGYGLRANRALVALAVTIALGTVAFLLVGFDAGTHAEDGPIIFAAESSISLLRAPDTENLTFWGHVTQILLRLAGPLFFALAVLALRGRVKR